MFKKLLVIVGLCLLTSAWAQNVKIIIPYAVGGVTDKLGRVIQHNLSQRLPAYNFQFEHQLGGGGLTATRYVVNYRGPDVLLLIHSPSIISSSFSEDAGYNLQRDFLPVFNLGHIPIVLVSNSKSAYTSIDKILSSDKPMFYGIAGFGGSFEIAGQILKRQTKKDMTAVPYKGESAAFNDVLTNSLSFSFISLSVIQGSIDSPQMVMLGITGTRRNPTVPNLPTLAEQGILGFETSPNWLSLFASRSANQEVVNNVRKALADSYRDPVESQSYIKVGMDIEPKTMLNAPAFIVNETARVQQILPNLQK